MIKQMMNLVLNGRFKIYLQKYFLTRINDFYKI